MVSKRRLVDRFLQEEQSIFKVATLERISIATMCES